jgi:hypothetical protein
VRFWQTFAENPKSKIQNPKFPPPFNHIGTTRKSRSRFVRVLHAIRIRRARAPSLQRVFGHRIHIGDFCGWLRPGEELRAFVQGEAMIFMEFLGVGFILGIFAVGSGPEGRNRVARGEVPGKTFLLPSEASAGATLAPIPNQAKFCRTVFCIHSSACRRRCVFLKSQILKSQISDALRGWHLADPRQVNHCARRCGNYARKASCSREP